MSIPVAAALLVFAVSTAWAQAPQAPPPRTPTELRADSLLRAGDAKGASALYLQAAKADTTVLRPWIGVAQAAIAMNDIPGAAAAFERASANGRNSTAMYNAGAMHGRLGHADAAITWVDKAVTAGFPQAKLLTTDPDLALVRDDPRFKAIVARAMAAFEPCMSDPEARRFDFWIGEWTVHPVNAPTVKAGESSVQRVSGGCALLENWTAANGAEGKSLNAYNGTTRQWQQFWIGQSGGVIEFRESSWDGNRLTLLAKGGTTWQRMSFSPVDANTTRQTGETSTDQGKTWTVGYDFHYRRK